MQLIECPRDAMQGIQTFIPTSTKIKYLNKLLRVGFHTLDFGSFVSPNAIPQMQDTARVLDGLNLEQSATKLLAIIANIRGAKAALEHAQIDYLGYPLSISETFQQRNTNKSIANALDDVAAIKELCEAKQKKLVVYISMGFGNPYNDPYSVEHLAQFTGILATLEADVVSLSDTIGVATPEQIEEIFKQIARAYPTIDLGVHLHSNPNTASAKIKAALKAGCSRIDGAILGYGGCPMAKDELTGNINTATIIETLNEFSPGLVSINNEAFTVAENFAKNNVFGVYQ